MLQERRYGEGIKEYLGVKEESHQAQHQVQGGRMLCCGGSMF
jgi:hypothetical protein